MKNKQPWGIIFDMDGVIFDTQKLIFAAEKILFTELEITLSHKQHESYAALRSWEFWKELKEHFGAKGTLEELVMRHRQFGFDYILQQGAEANAGVPELLSLLRSENIPLALATSGWKVRVDFMLEYTKLSDYFSAVVSGDDVAKSKPHPDIFLAAAEKLGIAPDRCIVIEDSSNGVLAAKRAGMKVGGFQNPVPGKQDLNMADFVFDDFWKLTVEKLREIVDG